MLKKNDRKIVLENGQEYNGSSFGSEKDAILELMSMRERLPIRGCRPMPVSSICRITIGMCPSRVSSMTSCWS